MTRSAEQLSFLAQAPAWRRNIGRAPSKPWGYSAAYNRFGTTRRGALQRGRAFELTFEQFRSISTQPCHYCGAPPAQVHRLPGRNGDFVCNGLDRRDNDRDYTLDNVLPCCWDCNHAKGSQPYATFVAWLNRIAAFRASRLGEQPEANATLPAVYGWGRRRRRPVR